MFISSVLKNKNYKNINRNLLLLKKQIQKLDNILESKNKRRLVELKNYFKTENQALPIIYILTIKFSLSNSMIILSNIKGETIFFCSSGSIQVKGKQKKNRKKVFVPLLNKLVSYWPYIKNKPISLHLINTFLHKHAIIKKISEL